MVFHIAGLFKTFFFLDKVLLGRKRRNFSSCARGDGGGISTPTTVIYVVNATLFRRFSAQYSAVFFA